MSEIPPVASCGMNCSICSAYLREKKKCPGCRGSDIGKPLYCIKCKLKTCEILNRNKSNFCFECERFPCSSLKHLDKRYRTKYGMSMIENLENIKNLGIEDFLRNEKIRWTCTECGGTICVHKGNCHNCGKKHEFKKYTI